MERRSNKNKLGNICYQHRAPNGAIRHWFEPQLRRRCSMLVAKKQSIAFK
jgi:hypothetical protein